MPVYRVETIFKETYINFVRADSEGEAKWIGHDLSTKKGSYSSECQWYDSEVYSAEEQECDND